MHVRMHSKGLQINKVPFKLYEMYLYSKLEASEVFQMVQHVLNNGAADIQVRGEDSECNILLL